MIVDAIVEVDQYNRVIAIGDFKVKRTLDHFNTIVTKHASILSNRYGIEVTVVTSDVWNQEARTTHTIILKTLNYANTCDKWGACIWSHLPSIDEDNIR